MVKSDVKKRVDLVLPKFSNPTKVTMAHAGLKQAIELKHLPMLNFAAQIDLDMVDLLESHFE